MLLGLFFGSFNPPHLNHLNIARIILNDLDEVWFVPCNHHAYGKLLIDYEHRFKMLKRMVSNEHMLGVCDIERNETEDSTYLILKKLQSTSPLYNLHLIIGQDNAENIHLWKNYKKLIDEFPIFTIQRENILPKQDAWYTKFPHKFIVNYSDYSSTDARKDLAKGIVPDMLHPKVASYISACGLYNYQ